MSETAKNVLLICTDHWPGNFLGCAAHPTAVTPTLDEFAALGTCFPNAYTPVPSCIPARRSLHTGMSAYAHGMFQNESRRMPKGVPSLAQTFRENGYHTVGVGKMEFFPTRARYGFDETILDFEGRGFINGELDDYELFLADEGYPGQRYAGGMCNNDYMYRPWHLDEHLHATNWTAQTMCRQIARRDPDKPGFWFLSFSNPHPPLDPLRDYLEIYRELEPPAPIHGEWSLDTDRSPRLAESQSLFLERSDAEAQRIRRAFYALCTQIDHQIRTVLGTLREHRLLKDTVIAFTSDHGDMLGDHGLWAKQNCFEGESRIPMLLCGPGVDAGKVDPRLVSLEDLYPTLLELAGIGVPEHVDALSMVGDARRKTVSTIAKPGGSTACRMIRDARHKLVYFPAGNQRLLFDLQEDPGECNDLAGDAAHAEALERLTAQLIDSFQIDGEREWIKDRQLVGCPYVHEEGNARNFHLQRGAHHPPVVRKVDYPY